MPMTISDGAVNAALKMLEVHRQLLEEAKDTFSKTCQRRYLEGLMDMAHIILSDNYKNGKDIRFNKNEKGKYKFRLADLKEEHEADFR